MIYEIQMKLNICFPKTNSSKKQPNYITPSNNLIKVSETTVDIKPNQTAV